MLSSFKQQVEQALQQGNTETVDRDDYVITYAVLDDGRRIQVDCQEKEQDDEDFGF